MNALGRLPTPGELWRSVVRVFSSEVDPLLAIAGLLVAVFLGVLTNAIYGWVLAWGSDLGLVVGLITLFICVVASLLIRLNRLRGRGAQMLVGSSPAPHAGLIYLLSLQIDTALCAIRHHGSALKHCWVIYTKEDARLRAIYDQLVVQIRDAGIAVEWHAVEVEADSDTKKARSESVYESVRSIYTGDLPQGLSPTQIITDITGGTRPIAAGAALACGFLQRSLEYVDSDYDPTTNRPIPGTQRVVAVQWK